MTDRTRAGTSEAERSTTARRTAVADLGVAGATAAAAALLWAVWSQVADVALEVKGPGGEAQDVGVVSVVVSTVVLVLAGGGLLTWMQRRSAAGVRRWTWGAVGFTALSLLTPTSAVTPAAGIALASLHLLVAAMAIVGLRRLHRDVGERAGGQVEDPVQVSGGQ